MPSGGARANAGRMPDPSSEAFQSRAQGLFALPAAGYKRPHPKLPLPDYEVWRTYKDDDGIHRELDAEASERWNRREREVWNDLWRYPQGYAWSRPQYLYLQHTVALYVRQYVLCETSDARAADRTTLCRYADAIGLTPQGLRLNGWRIIADEPPKRRRTSAKIVEFPDPRDEWASLQHD
ncbi:hypothetical protein [Bifidobacterium samirii]|uniref:Terminase n=1 Tax=Bifidobacterium samirii TaxID=2306974 RepID=A0A430FUK6_9BIFI|nr:hypothetical protein [Bifidobacterium samirii]RSX56762.1 hypothetical protein D2E24_1052 [Bifidobacterium samirii]